MNTIGWILLLFAAFLIRAVAKGRSITDLPSDISDAFTAAVSGDGAALSAVLARSGSSLDPVAPVAAPGAAGTATVGGTNLLGQAKELGGPAKGYRLGATGPDYYDCSGLVWRACKDIGVYRGLRFTTHTFAIQGSGFTKHVTTPMVGDIVLWPNHHMGIVSGNDLFYSALSRKSGIKDTAIHNISGTPVYYRLNTSIAPEPGDPGNGLGVLK